MKNDRAILFSLQLLRLLRDFALLSCFLRALFVLQIKHGLFSRLPKKIMVCPWMYWAEALKNAIQPCVNRLKMMFWIIVERGFELVALEL